MRLILAALALTVTAAPAFAQTGGRLDQFMRLDANADGAVTRAEARAGRGVMFDRVDTDGDGYLTEVERAALQSGGAMARGLANADDNSDGRISREELMEQPFPGFDRLDRNNDGTVSAEEIAAIRARMNGG